MVHVELDARYVGPSIKRVVGKRTILACSSRIRLASKEVEDRCDGPQRFGPVGRVGFVCPGTREREQRQLVLTRLKPDP